MGRIAVGIYSRKQIEKCAKENFDNIAVISFYTPEWRGRGKTEPVNFVGRCDRVMHIALHDLDPDALSEVGLSIETYFPEADALAEFIYSAKDDGLDIICQCDHGQSRSAGCAAAILQHFSKNGIDVFADYRYYPNQLVYNKTIKALEKYKKEQNK